MHPEACALRDGEHKDIDETHSRLTVLGHAVLFKNGRQRMTLRNAIPRGFESKTPADKYVAFLPTRRSPSGAKHTRVHPLTTPTYIYRSTMTLEKYEVDAHALKPLLDRRDSSFAPALHE